MANVTKTITMFGAKISVFVTKLMEKSSRNIFAQIILFFALICITFVIAHLVAYPNRKAGDALSGKHLRKKHGLNWIIEFIL